jgi:hypothetical protein
MATTSKDFRVKNGIQVNGDATIAGTITASAPTADNHVVTRSYLSSVQGAIPTSVATPSSPSNGNLWFDETTQRVNVYFGGVWMTLATITDANVLPDHIHDTSIDGNGLIATVLVTGGTVTDPQSIAVSAGDPATTDWAYTWNGGLVVDQYN